MPTFIIRLPNPDDPTDFRYMEWSTIMDAPRTYGMTRGEFEAYTLEWEGKNGLQNLAERLERADRYGTSLRPRGVLVPVWTWEEMVVGNRAGPDESELDHRGLWQHYVVERPEPEDL